jgi:catechol-2,3-dioxygenase
MMGYHVFKVPGLSTIGQIAITVTDVDRAARFYRDTLGDEVPVSGP